MPLIWKEMFNTETSYLWLDSLMLLQSLIWEIINPAKDLFAIIGFIIFKSALILV